MVQPVSPGQLPCSTSTRSGLSRRRRFPPCGPIGASGLSLPGRLSTWPDATRKAYATQWAAFVSWADDAGVPWLPAAPVDVAEFLAALVGRRVGLATVRHLGSVLSPGLRSGSQKTGCANRDIVVCTSGGNADVSRGLGRVKPLSKAGDDRELYRILPKQQRPGTRSTGPLPLHSHRLHSHR